LRWKFYKQRRRKSKTRPFILFERGIPKGSRKRVWTCIFTKGGKGER